MDTVDVGVIGAGIHGAATAFHLASAGASVVVFDRTSAAGGPTGRSSAICRAYYTNAFLAECARDSIAMFRDFEALTGRDAGFRRTGMLFLHPPEDAEAMRAAVGRLNELGIAVDVLSPEEIAATHPAFDLAGIGVAAYEHDAGYADPSAATLGLLDRARSMGAEARLARAVVRLDPSPGGGATIETDGGERTSCGRVLIAAGPWSRPLARQAGADLPLHAERHVVAAFRWGAAEPVPAHGDLVGGYYFRPEGDELYLTGPLPAEPEVDPDAISEEIAEHETARMAELVVRRVPHLAASEVARGWASLYDVSPDWQPVIGEIAPGIFVDAGTSGHGFKLAPALGAHVASMVLGEIRDERIAEFDPFRFASDRPLAAGYRDARILG
jgi:glycine/D-amino acid oxidase-like deaminating enzyme